MNSTTAKKHSEKFANITFWIFILSLLLIPAIESKAGESLRLSRQLLHSTVRIEALKTKGSSVGTGFFYNFNYSTNGTIPVIVTCAHVITGTTVGQIVFSTLTNDSSVPILPEITEATKDGKLAIRISNFEQRWIKHPDTNVDLAILPIGQYIRVFHAAGLNVNLVGFDSGVLPTPTDLESGSAFLNVKMIGYPMGLWDSVHNLPLVRTGLTATDPSVNYNGKPEFLVDVAVFPGSSGSPVVFAEEGLSGIGYNSFQTGDRIYLLGIAYARQEFDEKGIVTVVPIPTAYDLETHTPVGANLAFVIKAEKLRDFEPILAKFGSSDKK